ncbi:MAG TPA: hypothetical protein VN253_11605 [Kofleriaceae bacterium]|nr:hypothetical protein [Kofleriaceae bacterium]
MQLARVTVLALGLAASGACFHGGGGGGRTGLENTAEKARYAASAADALAFLPADSEFVLGLDMRQVVASPLWKQFEQRLMQRVGKPLQEFKAACGYDPILTLRTMTIGVKVVRGDDPEGVFVVRGPDRDKTLGCMRSPVFAKDGRTITVDRGVVTIPGKGAGDSPTVMTFVDASTAVFMTGPQATRAQLEAALASGAPLRKSRAFSELWSGVDPKQTLWIVVNGSSKMFDPLASLAARPKSVVGSLSLANGLSASGRVRFDSADQATQYASMLQGQLGMAKPMVEEVDVAADGPDLTLRLAMTVSQIESIVAMMGGMLGGGAGGP